MIIILESLRVLHHVNVAFGLASLTGLELLRVLPRVDVVGVLATRVT